MRKLTGYISVLTLLFSLIGFFPFILGLIYIIRDSDIIFKHDKYMNKNVLIDSLQYNDIDGGDAESVTGYSKELNNYKIKILLDIENDYVVTDEEMDENGSFKKNIWYRDGGNYAYATYKKDKKFPIKNLLYNRLEFPLLWFLSVFLTFFLNKKYKQLKKIENENKN